MTVSRVTSHRRFLTLLGVGLLAASLAAGGVKAPHADARSVSGQPVQVHTPLGMGYLCTWPGDGAFNLYFKFSTKGSTLSGEVSVPESSGLETVPMTGTVRGNHLTFLPLSGFGRYRGSVSGTELSLRADGGGDDIPGPATECSLVGDSKWRQTIPAMGFKLPPRGSSDTVAFYDLQMAIVGGGVGAADWAGTTLAFGHLAWHVHTTSGPVSATHDVSVTEIGKPRFIVEATRSATGRCWYLLMNRGSSPSNGGVLGLPTVAPDSSAPYASARGVVQSSCNSSRVGTPIQLQW